MTAKMEPDIRTANCWRCQKKVFEAEKEPGRAIPENTFIRRKCERCKAMNRIALDKVLADD